MDSKNYNKTDYIRQMLLRTVGKSPDLFCYFAAIQEAKELLGQSNPHEVDYASQAKPIRILAEI